MAKVMISIPDSLLERIDARVSALGETRSGFLQRLAEAELDAGESARRAEASRLMEKIETSFREGEVRYDVARLIREDRDSR